MDSKIATLFEQCDEVLFTFSKHGRLSYPKGIENSIIAVDEQGLYIEGWFRDSNEIWTRIHYVLNNKAKYVNGVLC